MPLEFKSSAALSLGVELELMVLNTHDYNLVRGAPDLLARLEKVQLDGEVKPEITESMIEVNSSVNTNYDDLRRELKNVRDAIVVAAQRLNVAVAGGGSHPFHKWNERRIYPRNASSASRRSTATSQSSSPFSASIHIGVENGDDAVYLTHHLSRYIPHFIALSASSPFSQGEDTSFETSRLHAVSSFPLSGRMPTVRNWAEFSGYFDEMQHYGIVEA
jgi:carboxylate-amine ligase